MVTSIACGPSLKKTYESTRSYERCYAADYDPQVSPETRRACWSDWLETHAKDQPPERITFAERRLLELARDGSTRPLPLGPGAPAPKREHRYPPVHPGHYHSSSCDPVCERGWDECTSYCALEDKACKAACESEFRICIEGCP